MWAVPSETNKTIPRKYWNSLSHCLFLFSSLSLLPLFWFKFSLALTWVIWNNFDTDLFHSFPPSSLKPSSTLSEWLYQNNLLIMSVSTFHTPSSSQLAFGWSSKFLAWYKRIFETWPQCIFYNLLYLLQICNILSWFWLVVMQFCLHGISVTINFNGKDLLILQSPFLIPPPITQEEWFLLKILYTYIYYNIYSIVLFVNAFLSLSRL